MRPQGFGPSHGFDDLGWNDMGHVPPPVEELEDEDLPEHVPSSIAALTPAPKLPRSEEAAAEPEVVAQQRAIAESFPAEADVEEEVEAAFQPAPTRSRLPGRGPRSCRCPSAALRLGSAPAQGEADEGRKAAFTLRLDAERHLRLRLASAVTGQSAQQIVTSALDALLESIPEVEALAERAMSAKAKRN